MPPNDNTQNVWESLKGLFVWNRIILSQRSHMSTRITVSAVFKKYANFEIYAFWEKIPKQENKIK